MSSGRIMLAPAVQEGKTESISVTMQLDAWQNTDDGTVCRAQLETVSVPGAVPENLQVRDARGTAALISSDYEQYPIRYRSWKAQRSLTAPVTVSYEVRTAEPMDHGRHGPYFRLAREKSGFSGPGIAFLMEIPAFDGSVDLAWDLTRAQPGMRGVCTWGEGGCEARSLEDARQCYYMFGDIQSVGEGDFGFYWLTPPPFDVRAIAGFTKNLFGIMQRFFHDTEKVYRIFMRHDLTESSGGTALERSYMFGWNANETTAEKVRQNLLAHEMVHNWPHLNDQPYGTTTWYAEGTAEFYSIMIPLRYGLCTAEEALSEIQKRTDAYFTNPTRHLSNMDAASVAWKDRRAQRLSYGRGIFFLASVDARIRRASGGGRSLDDVVLDILERGRRGETLSNEVFLESVRTLGGVDVTEEWKAMSQGGDVIPDPDSFDALFHLKQVMRQEADTGMEAVSYVWTLRREEKDSE